MRARAITARTREAFKLRDYLYVGGGKGADVVAWQQAARAEHASYLRVGHAQVFLDLVKACERVPWHILVREATALGYRLWLLRLSIAGFLACLAMSVPSPILAWAHT